MPEETNLLDEMLDTSSKEEEKPEEGKEAEGEEPEATPEEQELKPAEVRQLLNSLQKGYTMSRQELAEIKEALAAKAAPSSDGDEYVTKSSLREIVADVLNSRDNAAVQAQVEAKNNLEEQFNELVLSGELPSGLTKEEKEDFFTHGLHLKEFVDLGKVARSWVALRQARGQGKAKQAEEAIKQKREQGSKVGSSEKSGSGSGLSYEQIHSMSFDDIDI